MHKATCKDNLSKKKHVLFIFPPQLVNSPRQNKGWVNIVLRITGGGNIEMNEIAANYPINSTDLRRPFGRPFGFGHFGYGRRPWGYRPYGFGFPFAAGLLGGLAAGSLIGGPYGYGYPYGGYPYPYTYPAYPYYPY